MYKKQQRSVKHLFNGQQRVLHVLIVFFLTFLQHYLITERLVRPYMSCGDHYFI